MSKTYSTKANGFLSEVEADGFYVDEGYLIFYIGESPIFEKVAVFAPGEWAGTINLDNTSRNFDSDTGSEGGSDE